MLGSMAFYQGIMQLAFRVLSSRKGVSVRESGKAEVGERAKVRKRGREGRASLL
jgi:hypothetical protein